MRIGWVGFHEEGLPALEALLDRGAVVGVMTLRPKKAARRSAAADYAGLCGRYGVPLAEVGHVNDPASIEILRSWRADLVLVIGWSQILSPEALAQARVGTLGAHASLLPHGRGSAPINWALIRGEKQTGNSLMWLSADVDDGDLVDQTAFDITPYDTCASLYAKVAESNRAMILKALDAFERGERPRRPQGETGEPLLPRRRPADGKVDWTREASELYRFVRALTRPYPGAFSYLAGEKWTLWQAVLLDVGVSAPAPPGTVVGALRSPETAACGLIVACGSGLLGILEMESPARNLAGIELAETYREGLRFTDE